MESEYIIIARALDEWVLQVFDDSKSMFKTLLLQSTIYELHKKTH